MSGKVVNFVQRANKPDISVTFFISHFEISGKVDNEEQSKNV